MKTVLGIVALAATMLGIEMYLLPQSQPSTDSVTEQQTDTLSGVEITLYRSPSCGCCAGHAAALEEAGATVSMQNIDATALQSLKQENNIPFDKQSCHTAFVDDYVIEGHVPIDAIAQLLEERPDTNGITLPGMPIGTPGMPGRQTQPYIVETLEGDTFWQQNPS